MTEYSMAEVVRRLEEVAQQNREILKELRADRAENARTFVRSDVYEARHKALSDAMTNKIAEITADVAKLEERATKADDRLKQFGFGLLASFILLIAGAFVTLAQLTGGGVG